MRKKDANYFNRNYNFFFFLEIMLLKLAYETGFSKSFFSWYKDKKKIVKHNRNIF